MKYKVSLKLLPIIASLLIGACSHTNVESSSSEIIPGGEESSQQMSSEPTRSSEVSSASSAKQSSAAQSSAQQSSAISSSASASSASSSSSESKPATFKAELAVKMPTFLNTTNEYYDLTVDFDDAYFLNDAEAYNKDLSMLSLGASVVTGVEAHETAFLTGANFSDITPYGYDAAPTDNSIGYFLAHKKIDDFELVAVVVRGFQYGREWSNNFYIGETGDHAGFSLCATEVYTQLQTYVSNKVNNTNLKFWITGYSRGGAVSNILSHFVLSGDKLAVARSNLFAYTFEAPACLETAHCVAYENVFNVTNKNDLVALVPPAKFGFGRCGTDYQIYDENVSALMKAFDEKAIIPDFVAIPKDKEPITNDDELANFFLKCAFNKETTNEDEIPWTCNTREEYATRYQRAFRNMIGLIFALSEETRSTIMTDFSNLGFSALSVIGDGEQLANFLKTYLDKDNVQYDETVLVEDCTVLTKAIAVLFLEPLLIFGASNTYRPSLQRLVAFHYPETEYVLLKNADSK